MVVVDTCEGDSKSVCVVNYVLVVVVVVVAVVVVVGGGP